MKKTFYALALAASFIASSGPAAFAAAAPACEDKLAAFRTAMTGAKISAADMKKVKDLEVKGVERCNADDDKRANDFIAQGMKLLGK